jgi:hypothetical protein
MESQTKESNLKKDKSFICECGKKYTYESTLLNHKKKCKKVEELQGMSPDLENKDSEEYICKEIINEKDFLMKLIKENQELKKIILEQHNKLVEQEENLIEYVKNILIKIISASSKNIEEQN